MAPLGIPKGGLQIAGHRVPWEAIGAVAAVLGVILVLRARQQGQNVASVGQAPATAADTGFGSLQPDFSGALANISQQLTTLQQGAPSSPATPATPAQTLGLVDTNNPNWLVPVGNKLGGPPIAWLPQGTPATLVGSPQPFTWGGKSGLAEEVSILGSDYWVNVLNLPLSSISH